MDCDDDEEAKVQNTKSQRLPSGNVGVGQRLNFEILFGKKHPDVQYFIFFSNLVNILHAGPTAAATKVKIQIRGFLQLGQTTVATALDKLLMCYPVSAFLSGKWEPCNGGQYGNEEYETCQAEKSPWMPIQTLGEFGISNKGRAANKSPQTTVIASSDVLSFIFHFIQLHAPQGKVRIRKSRKRASVAGSVSSFKSASVVLPLFSFPYIAVSNFEILNLDFES
jgi:hypothetical protein